MVISVLALAGAIAAVVVGKALGGLLIVGIVATTWSMFFRPMHSAASTARHWRSCRPGR